jgi:Acetyltransferase (GNAT) domain
MSVSLHALFPPRKGWDKPQNLCPDLSASFVPPGSSAVVMLSASPDSDFTLSLRQSRDTDLPAIYNWISLEYTGLMKPVDSLPQQFEEAYSSIAQSDSVQTFIGLVNELPVCQLEIHKAIHHAISLYYETRPHDYLMHVQVASPAIPEHTAALLHSCVGYFLNFPEVDRIFAETDKVDQPSNTLLKEAGFRLYKKIHMPYKTANLYICTGKFSALD